MDRWFVFLPASPVETQAPAILVTAGIFILLSLVTMILLGHLLTFHIYLCRYFVPVIYTPISFLLIFYSSCIHYVFSHVTYIHPLFKIAIENMQNWDLTLYF